MHCKVDGKDPHIDILCTLKVGDELSVGNVNEAVWRCNNLLSGDDGVLYGFSRFHADVFGRHGEVSAVVPKAILSKARFLGHDPVGKV
jgi:hypothetical protein